MRESSETLSIPYFPESKHPLIQSLVHHSDRELLKLFQRYPEQGRYFTAIFCRYSGTIYALIVQEARSPLQLDYFFALTWREIFRQMAGLTLPSETILTADIFPQWLLDLARMCLQQQALLSDKSRDYDLTTLSPPLWCYLEQALEQLPPLVRFIVVMAEKFQWSPTRIVAYLQSEGEMLSPHVVEQYLHQGYQLLPESLPEDIRRIYLLN